MQEGTSGAADRDIGFEATSATRQARALAASTVDGAGGFKTDERRSKIRVETTKRFAIITFLHSGFAIHRRVK